MEKYVSIDIGGTSIKYGLISENGSILYRSETPTKAFHGGASVLNRIIKITGQFCSEKIAGICISTAGVVNTKNGSVIYAGPTMPDYTGIQLKKEMEAQFHIRCEVENDVNCAGLAEYRSGAGKDCDPMLMLTVGTGIGGCLITGGQVFHGFQYGACEIGYLHMRGSNFQALASTSSLVKKIANIRQEPEENWNGRQIFQKAKQGDADCIQAIDEMADTLGLGIANICYVTNPEIVVLGGGIMAQQDYMKDRIQKAVELYLTDSVTSKLQIVFAKHGNDAGMLGAFYHFIDVARRPGGC